MSRSLEVSELLWQAKAVSRLESMTGLMRKLTELSRDERISATVMLELYDLYSELSIAEEEAQAKAKKLFEEVHNTGQSDE